MYTNVLTLNPGDINKSILVAAAASPARPIPGAFGYPKLALFSKENNAHWRGGGEGQHGNLIGTCCCCGGAVGLATLWLGLELLNNLISS